MTTPSPETQHDAGALRERGKEVTRLEAFVDAAFAFAVTLLVISLDAIPDSIPALINALKGIPAFAASFALIAFFWHLQARWSRRYGLDDGVTTWLSLLLVFLVLVYVYPLRMLFSAMFHWISGRWLPAGFVVTGIDDLRVMYIVYAIAWGTMGLVVLALYRHAWKLREALGLNLAERTELRGTLASISLMPITGVMSALAAVLVPESAGPAAMAIPGMCYWLMALTGRVASRAERRYLRQAGASQ